MTTYKHLKFAERKGTNCDKWDGLSENFGRDDLIPAWVADMDIESPACVQQALADAVAHNVYGYYRAPGNLYRAFMEWEKKYHGYEVKEEWIRFAPGVVQSIYWLLEILTEPGDGVVILEPVYYPFRNAIRETGRTVCAVPLINEGGRYRINYDALEREIVESGAKVHIMCSPHNPVGRVWRREEIKRVMGICRKHGVYVIADEIHQDLVIQEAEWGGENPFRENMAAASAGAPGEYDSILITLTSASKTFNLAGMQNSFVIIPEEALRKKFDRFTTKIHIKDGGNLGYISYTAAYEQGREWLQELRGLIRDNAALLKERLEEGAPKAVLSPLEGTYLQWVDLSAYAEAWEAEGLTAEDFVLQRCGVAPDFGEWFGGEAYKNFIRLNLATSPANAERIAARLIRGISTLHL